MVTININLDKRFYFISIILASLLIISGVVVAFNSSPANPSVMGHSLNEIDSSVCADGQVIKKVGGVWSCGDAGGISSCTIRTATGSNSGSNTVGSASCNTGEKLTGGGCKSTTLGSELSESYPNSATSYYCKTYPTTGTLTIYAICCL